MADTNELLRLMKELDDQLVSCMKCGMCQAVCPVYADTGREMDVARGKIALLEGLARDMIRDAEGVKARLDKCLLCGSCAANCPSGVKVLDIFLKARAILTGYLGLSPVKKAIFQGMLVHPKLFNGIMGLAAKFQGIFTQPVNEALGSSCSRFLSGVIGDRHFASLADKPLRSLVGALDTPAGASGLKVAFYPGCLVDKIFPRIGLAVIKVLKHHGVGIFLPDVQACCGIPALASGDLSTFEDLVAANVAYYAGIEYDVLITPCATCTSTIKKVWPIMSEGLAPSTRAKAEAMAAKTMDINAFLVDKLGVTPGAAAPGAVKVTYHDPCHLKKSLGVAAQPRAVLSRNPDFALVEMAASDSCCGCGGSFNLQHYETSKRIGMMKRDNIAATGASVVATGCPACMLQITDMLSQAGDSIRVKHPVELYAEALP
jgi:glycolate oxidase iron-sulfur subunit